MAKSDPVKVAVEIIDKFEKDLKELEARLDKIDGKTLNVSLDIDAEDIEEVEARLKEIEDRLTATLKIDVDGFGKAKAMKEELEKDMFSTLHIDTNKRGLGGLGVPAGFDPPKRRGYLPTQAIQRPVRENLEAVHGPSYETEKRMRRFNDRELEIVNRWINQNVAGRTTTEFGIGQRYGPEPRHYAERAPISADEEFMRNIRSAIASGEKAKVGDGLFSTAKFGDDRFRAKGFDPDLFMGKRSRMYPYTLMGDIRWELNEGIPGDLKHMKEQARTGVSRARSAVGAVPGKARSFLGDVADSTFDADGERREGAFGHLRDSLRRLMPSMHKWWRLVALVLPLMIALAGAALGLAAAFGAVAMAGAAMVGFGLLGYGDSLGESMKNAAQKVKELKQELFGVFRPIAATFQPFVEQLFARIPDLAERLVDPFQRLEQAGYAEFLTGALDGMTDVLVDLINLASDLAPQIQAILGAFGAGVGGFIIDFLRAMVEEVYNNWHEYASLARIVGYVVTVIWNLSKAIGFALTVFEPLFAGIAWFTGHLGNPFMAAMIAAIGGAFLFGIALDGIIAKLVAIRAIAIAQAFWTAATSVGSLAGALGALSGLLTGIIGQLTAINILTGGLAILAGLAIGAAAYNHFSGDTTAAGALGGRGGGVPAEPGTTVNIYGNVGDREYQKMQDQFPGMWQEQSNINAGRQR